MPFKSPEELYEEVVSDHTSRLHQMTLAEMKAYLREHEVELQAELPGEEHDVKEVLFRDIHTVELDIVYTDPAGNKTYLFEESQKRVDAPVKRKRKRRGLSMKYDPDQYALENGDGLPLGLLSDLLEKELSADEEIPLQSNAVRKVHDENVLILRDSYLIPTHARTERYEVEISEETHQALLRGFTSFSASRKTIGHFVFAGGE